MAFMIYCRTSNSESKAEKPPSALTRWVEEHGHGIAREHLDIAGVNGHREILDDLVDAAEDGHCHMLALPDLYGLTRDPRVLVQLIREVGALGAGVYGRSDGRHDPELNPR